MAKSLRSKWRRKCRAVKRVRYGAKELARLKKTLGITDQEGNVDMKDVSEVATVIDAKAIKEKKEVSMSIQNSKQDSSSVENAVQIEPMDDGKVKRVYNKRTMKDQFGNYPVWMNQRHLNEHKKSKKTKGRRKRAF